MKVGIIGTGPWGKALATLAAEATPAEVRPAMRDAAAVAPLLFLAYPTPCLPSSLLVTPFTVPLMRYTPASDPGRDNKRCVHFWPP